MIFLISESCKYDDSSSSEFLKQKINKEYYYASRNIFWWSYGLDLAALSYMASFSNKEDRWSRVTAVALVPLLYDLVFINLFYPDKFHIYENPIFLDIKNDGEIKEHVISLGFESSF